ncbi:transcription elongation factor SPT6-like [Sesbania bispinosa]|nr:transcription elongation factor SPT6-like [Sesbania bispinosa]
MPHSAAHFYFLSTTSLPKSPSPYHPGSLYRTVPSIIPPSHAAFGGRLAATSSHYHAQPHLPPLRPCAAPSRGRYQLPSLRSLCGGHHRGGATVAAGWRLWRQRLRDGWRLGFSLI